MICKLGWHNWNKYGEMVSAYAGLCQFRSCKKCNKISYTSCYGNQAKPDQINKALLKVVSSKMETTTQDQVNRGVNE